MHRLADVTTNTRYHKVRETSAAIGQMTHEAFYISAPSCMELMRQSYWSDH